jgi:hypothetical protein
LLDCLRQSQLPQKASGSLPARTGPEPHSPIALALAKRAIGAFTVVLVRLIRIAATTDRPPDSQNCQQPVRVTRRRNLIVIRAEEGQLLRFGYRHQTSLPGRRKAEQPQHNFSLNVARRVAYVDQNIARVKGDLAPTRRAHAGDNSDLMRQPILCPFPDTPPRSATPAG